MLKTREIQSILSRFGLSFTQTPRFCDSSRGDGDLRLNYILDNRYVLKIQSTRLAREARLQEISRLIARYRAIGVYCPRMLPTLEGPLSCEWAVDGVPHTCFVEEFARYPLCPEGMEPDRREVLAHLGLLAARYSGVDLWETRSVWSLIDLGPLDVDVDEKQENANTLVQALEDAGLKALAHKVAGLNEELRAVIRAGYRDLPRCVYQGDLNNTNLLLEDGHFKGLIDFNLSGTDVNINIFLNESNWFPEEEQLASMTVPEILNRMHRQQTENLAVIFRSYTLNDREKQLFPYYRRIVDLFQYPNVCLMQHCLTDDARRSKAVELIQALIEKPL